MPTLEVKLPHHRYDVHIEPGSLKNIGDLVRAVAPHDKAVIIADANVEQSHAVTAERSMKLAGYATDVAIMPSGEPHKTMGTYQRLLDVLLDARLERGSPVVALGGGITGDTAGFVAATYLRGVPLVQCPTTLLAMVDASVGGKVGVNVAHGKNLIGAFYQPRAVVIDTETLDTLPSREIRCGLAECVKHGMIRDEALFAWIGDQRAAIQARDSVTMVELVRRNVGIKAQVVAEDEKEAGVRAHLNFGHTFGHAIEAVTGYGRVLHGEAVSLGMVAATVLAVEIGRCESHVIERLTELLKLLGLPVTADLPDSALLTKAMGRDKKVQDSALRLVIPRSVGQVEIISTVAEGQIRAAWNSVQS